MTKICTKCGIEKELTDYHKEKSVKSGVRSDCKKCNNKRIAIYYKNNKEYRERKANQLREGIICGKYKYNNKHVLEYERANRIQINYKVYRTNTCDENTKPIVEMLINARNIKRGLRND